MFFSFSCLPLTMGQTASFPQPHLLYKFWGEERSCMIYLFCCFLMLGFSDSAQSNLIKQFYMMLILHWACCFVCSPLWGFDSLFLDRLAEFNDKFCFSHLEEYALSSDAFTTPELLLSSWAHWSSCSVLKYQQPENDSAENGIQHVWPT